ncbi:MAG: 6-hydroxymethylpterin diphosphokinase MptE-like protein [Polyangiales bacterium]
MQLQLLPSTSGARSLRLGETWLEDPTDPVAGATTFIRPEQVAGADHVVLFGAGLGYRILWLKQIGVPHPIVFEPLPEILRLSRKTLPQALDGAQAFSDHSSLLAHLRTHLQAGERMILLAPPGYQDAFQTEYQQLQACLRDAHGFAQLRRNTVNHRLVDATEYAVRNLAALSAVPCAERIQRPLAGCPVFIVSAGPSLDRNAHLLPEAARRGAIFAVNTSAPVVVAQGQNIDVLVTIEALPVHETLAQVAPHTHVLAIDLSAHPSGFALPGPEAGGPCKVALSAQQAGMAQLNAALKLQGFQSGPSVSTMALCLARQWGADPIVLLGQDLAFPEGRVYAAGTGREHWRATAVGAELSLVYDEAIDALFASNRLKPPPRKVPRLQVPAWGKGTPEHWVDSTYELTWVRRWLEEAASQDKSARRYINASEGGAAILGFEERTLASLWPELPVRAHRLMTQVQPAQALPSARVDQARRVLGAAIRQIRDQARAYVQRKSPSGAQAQAVLQQAQRSSLVWAHVAAELHRVQEDNTLDSVQRVRAAMQAIADSAARLGALLQ